MVESWNRPQEHVRMLFNDPNPNIPLSTWRDLFQKYLVPDNVIQDLRNTPPHMLLKTVFPIVSPTNKGVYLEYDLSNNLTLFDKCRDLIINYMDVSTQSANLLAQVVDTVGSIATSGTSSMRLPSDIGPTQESISSVINSWWDYAVEIANYVAEILIPEKAVLTQLTKPVEELSFKSTYKNVNQTTLRNLEIELRKIMSKGIQSIRQGLSKLDGAAAADFEDIMSKWSKELKEWSEKAKGLLFKKEDSSATGVGSQFLIIRLYPNQATINYGPPSINVTQLSHNKYLTTKRDATNINLILGGNLALNSPDTQWFRFYGALFRLLVDHGNPDFSVVVGSKKIERCNLAVAPMFAEHINRTMELFNVTVISAETGFKTKEA